MQHLAAKAIEDREADVGAVLARIDIHAKRPLAERRVDDPDDGIGHGRGVRVGRHYGRNGILHLLTETGIRPRLISAMRASSAGRPEWAKWLVPPVKAPGTMIEVSMPQRLSSLA